MDHDQRFKALLREFFPEFLTLFFPQWASCFDLSRAEYLDQELLPNPPEGERLRLDLVAKLLATKPLTANQSESPSEWLALVHVEVESPDRTTSVKPRLPRYYVYLRDREQLPVLPVVLYLRVGLNGIGVDEVVETIGDFTVLTYRYLYVGLPALDAVQYAQGENALGIALSALMNVPSEAAVDLTVNTLYRIRDLPNVTDKQRYLLHQCVMGYSPLQGVDLQQFQRRVMSEPGLRNLFPPYYDIGIEEGMQKGMEKGIQKGRQEGRQEGLAEGIQKGKEEGIQEGMQKGMQIGKVEAELATLRRLAIGLLEERFQSLPETIRARMDAMNATQLQNLTFKISKVASLDELFPQ